MTTVILPDGSQKEFDSVVTVHDVAKSIGSRLAKDASWGEIDHQPVELEQATQLGAVAHSLAADIVVERQGERGLFATGLLPEIRRLVNARDD